MPNEHCLAAVGRYFSVIRARSWSLLSHPIVRIDRSQILALCVYLAAANAAINPLTASLVADRATFERLDLWRLTLGWNLTSGAVIALALRLPRQLQVTVRLGQLAVVLLGTIVLTEGVLRLFLFSGIPAPPALQSPGLYADSEADDDYWVLYHYYLRAPFRTPTSKVHPTLGWIQSNGGSLGVRSERYFHLGDVKRRPVAFFGDSFVAGGDVLKDALPQMMEPLLPDLAVLNYGVGGYATDQTVLRCLAEAPKLKPLDPILLVGVLLDDMDRSLLRFRISQKPYFELLGGTAYVRYPAYEDNAEFLARYRFQIQSFAMAAARRLLFKAAGWDNGNPERRTAVNRAVFRHLAENLRREGLKAHVVIFYGEPDLARILGGRPSPREQELKRILSDVGLPYLDTLGALRAAMGTTAVRLSDLFLPDAHYNPVGNRILAAYLASEVSRVAADGKPTRTVRGPHYDSIMP